MNRCGGGAPQNRPDRVYKSPLVGLGRSPGLARERAVPATRGEGMPQDHVGGRKLGHTPLMRAAFMRAVLGAALAALVVCANTAAARAGDGDDSDSVYNKLMRVLGMKNPLTMEYGIDYSERSPLVVPPTRDLPPPVAAARRQRRTGPKTRTSNDAPEPRPNKRSDPTSIGLLNPTVYCVQTSSIRPVRRDRITRVPLLGTQVLNKTIGIRVPAPRRASSASTGSRRKNTRRLPASRRGRI